MQKIKLAALLVLLVIMNVTYALSSSINWKHYSKDAFVQAKKEHRLILIYGKADWCHWCQRMLKTTWVNPTVIQLVSGRFIPLQVDIDQDGELAQRYGINATPTMVIVDANDKILKTMAGYTDPQEMANELSAVSEKYLK